MWFHLFYCVLTLFFAYFVRFPWYDLEEDKETGTVLFRHDSETTFTPEELFGMILNHSRIIAEKFAGKLHAPVYHVLTKKSRPAHSFT